MLTCGLQMVSVAKTQVREIASLMEGALMRNEDVVHQVIHVDNDDEYNVVQVSCRNTNKTATTCSVHFL